MTDDSAGSTTPSHPQGLQEQFEDIHQQESAGNFGMWLFLATEVLFFGGVFAAYIIYRLQNLPAFEAGSRELNVKFGAANTVVLIASSLCMALSIRCAQLGKRKLQVVYLILTMVLGTAFLFVKFTFEWTRDYHEHLIPGFGFHYPGPLSSGVELFFCFYFFMTGLHAVHMIIGIGILIALTVMTVRGKFTPVYYFPMENTGLYWHFVDIVWIFLFPLLYLVGGRY